MLVSRFSPLDSRYSTLDSRYYSYKAFIYKGLRVGLLSNYTNNTNVATNSLRSGGLSNEIEES